MNHSKTCIWLWMLATVASGQEIQPSAEPRIEPTWESMAEYYQVPQWFVDGKLGVWFHWGISSAIDENRPNDGSHYGRRMYGPNDGETGRQLKMTETLKTISHSPKKTFVSQRKTASSTSLC
ncbi:alpha-L-fucosidase [Neorhodopirellula pilleata]|nr:alpha-L-fucosidase [Neorhodopirellula pilleata]